VLTTRLGLAAVGVAALSLVATSSGSGARAADGVTIDGMTEVAVEPVEVDADGSPSFATSVWSISDDGRLVLYFSAAENAGDSLPLFGHGKLWVWDRATDSRTPVATDAEGEPVQGLGCCGGGELSGDGRFVVFGHKSRRLVSSGHNPNRYVFVKNLKTGLIERTRLTGPAEYTGWRLPELYVGAVSGNGRYVAGSADFETDEFRRRPMACYLLDRKTDELRWISPLDRERLIQCNTVRALSDDGRYAVWQVEKRFGVYDRVAGSSTRLPPHPDGEVWLPSGFIYSDDGRLVVTDWFNRNTYEESVLLQRRATGTVVEEVTALGSVSAISADGRYLIGEANPEDFRWWQAYRYDRRTDKLLLVSRNARGRPANFYSGCCLMSADGQVVGFTTPASNLVPGDEPLGADSDDHDWDGFLATTGPN